MQYNRFLSDFHSIDDRNSVFKGDSLKVWTRKECLMTRRQVVALGGSLLRPEESEQRTAWFGQIRQLAVHIEGNGRHLGIVVGGGLPAR